MGASGASDGVGAPKTVVPWASTTSADVTNDCTCMVRVQRWGKGKDAEQKKNECRRDQDVIALGSVMTDWRSEEGVSFIWNRNRTSYMKRISYTERHIAHPSHHMAATSKCPQMQPNPSVPSSSLCFAGLGERAHEFVISCPVPSLLLMTWASPQVLKAIPPSQPP